MSESIWTKSNILLPRFEKLKGHRKTDVLIIGGGICGLLCGYLLKEVGADCIIAEAAEVCSGITKDTTAKITSQHGLVYEKMIRTVGKEKTRMYLDANECAVSRYREMAAKMDCDFEEKPAFTYSVSDRGKVEAEVQALHSIGFPAEYAECTELPFQTAGAVCFMHQAQFHPLKFAAAIAKDQHIFEHTFVRGISGHTVVTDGGTITADKIIVATHFPFSNKHGSYFLKMYQHRSYVLALENASADGSTLNGMYVDDDKKGMSFRGFQNLLFVGGGGHRTGKQGGSWQELRRFVQKYYPTAREAAHWAAQDCMSLDGIPYIGHYSKHTPYIYVATGFNKWGMTSAMASAMILRDVVMGMDNPWQEVFSPSRSMIKPQLAVNGAAAVMNLLTPSLKRCPHMGCALKWNRNEHTWDCPCHGSRFEDDGKLIGNPAMRDALGRGK